MFRNQKQSSQTSNEPGYGLDIDLGGGKSLGCGFMAGLFALGTIGLGAVIVWLVGQTASRLTELSYARAAQLDAQANLQDARNAATTTMLAGMFPYLVIGIVAIAGVVLCALLLKSRNRYPGPYNPEFYYFPEDRSDRWYVGDGAGGWLPLADRTDRISSDLDR